MTTIVLLDIPAGDARDAVLALMRDALPVTRAFDGCEGLELLANQDDTGNILIYERWQSRAHYDALLRRGCGPIIRRKPVEP